MKDKISKRPENEKDIDEFLKHADLIYNSKYLQEKQKQEVKVSWKKGEALKISSTGIPERETIESFLMRMRPVMVYEERFYIGKIVTYLIAHSETDEERKYLLDIQNKIEQHRNKRLFSIKFKDNEYGMPDFVWLYLYGKYFHLDKDKQLIINELEQMLGSLTEVSALSQIEGYAGWALILAGYIKRKRSGKLK